MASGFLEAFLGALQASVAVLLTILYGAIAAQFDLLSEGAARDISKTCVRLFLPALLFTNLGSELHLETAMRYLPVLIWAIVYNVASMALGIASTRFFKLPPWVTPAVAFNNTTSLPLLLVQSLGTAGVLETLYMSAGDSVSAAVERARSYFLINAMVSNSLTFALGPKLLNGHEEDAPDKVPENDDDDHQQRDDDDVEDGRRRDEDDEESPEDEAARASEETSLLPRRVAGYSARVAHRSHAAVQRGVASSPAPVRAALRFLYQFANAPLLGAALGALVGLVPPLHRAFFAAPASGGVLSAWLTSSIKNVGGLFAALQVVVVGVKLARSLRRMAAGEASGEVPWASMAFVMLVRFALWPAIAIPLVWALAKRTSWLGDDPVLWFAMMLMPTGPPAMKLTALADVSGSDEKEKMSIAKFLTISYAISPLICFSVVGSLKASESLIGK